MASRIKFTRYYDTVYGKTGYVVWDGGERIGYVFHHGRHWLAKVKPWAGGALMYTTRAAAADHLYHWHQSKNTVPSESTELGRIL